MIIYHDQIFTSMVVEYTAKIMLSGTSLVVAIPKPVTNGLKLKKGDTVKLIVTNDQIIIKKA